MNDQRDVAQRLVVEVLSEYTGLSPHEIRPEMHVQDDLGIDSIDAIELLVAMERRSGLRFDVDELEDLVTIADLVSKLVQALDRTAAT